MSRLCRSGETLLVVRGEPGELSAELYLLSAEVGSGSAVLLEDACFPAGVGLCCCCPAAAEDCTIPLWRCSCCCPPRKDPPPSPLLQGGLGDCWKFLGGIRSGYGVGMAVWHLIVSWERWNSLGHTNTSSRTASLKSRIAFVR